MIVSGTMATIPARMAFMYVFSLTTVSGGTTYLFKNPVAWFILSSWQPIVGVW